MMNEMTWNIPVVIDLFFAGLGGGSFCLAAITSRKKGQGWDACSRMASFLAPLALLIGLSMLIIDLGYRSRFWVTLKVFNLNSPMSIGVWLMSAFVLVSIWFALYSVPAHIRQRIPWIGRLSIWSRLEYRNRMGVIGTLFSVGVMVYTGVLLSVSIIPMWRALSLPLLFFLSALSTGFAGGAILGMVSLSKRNLKAMKEPLRFLRQSYRIILPFYLLVALAFVLSLAISSVSRTEAIHFMTGWSGLIWWFGFVGIGIVFPLTIVMRKGEIKIPRAWFLFGSILVGGFLLRLVLVLSGQGAL